MKQNSEITQHTVTLLIKSCIHLASVNQTFVSIKETYACKFDKLLGKYNMTKTDLADNYRKQAS